MVIESGNGRVMALLQAYRRDRGENYRRWLIMRLSSDLVPKTLQVYAILC